MNVSTKLSPFFANKGFHPRMSFGPPKSLLPGNSRTVKDANLDGNKFATKMQHINDVLQSNLRSAQVAQETHANRNRAPAPAYKVGDMVFLDRRNISSGKKISKLDNKYLGPYAIKKILNSHAYQLDLPHELKSIDNSFHTSLLHPMARDPLPGQTQSPPQPVSYDEQGQKLWQIEEIVNSRQVRGQFQYRVKWRGGETTWDVLDNIVTAKGSIAEFEERFPKKKRPTKEQITAALARNAANELAVETAELGGWEIFEIDESDESELESSNLRNFGKPHVGWEDQSGNENGEIMEYCENAESEGTPNVRVTSRDWFGGY